MANAKLYVAGDFSGIQDYVLGITAAGGGQARRLRARSFYVQVLGEAAVKRITATFCPEAERKDAVLMSGGGQFMLALPGGADTAKLEQIQRDMELELYQELRGELGFTLAWAQSVPEALHARERSKRRAWASTLTTDGRWLNARMVLPEIAPPCQICRKQRATTTRHDEESICDRCAKDIEIREKLPKTEHIRFAADWGEFSAFQYNIRLSGGSGDTRPLGRYVPVGPDGRLLTFEDVAAKASGDHLLGVFKADVDNMGVKIGELAERDPSYAELRTMSGELDRFFSENLQQLLRNTKEFEYVYTVYSGGDDLLLVGAWDVILNLAKAVYENFKNGPGRTYGLTLSAGIALTKPRLPIRHAVERAEQLLTQAKKGTKNQCATLGGVWAWDRHSLVLGEGRRLHTWIKAGIANRSMIHRLYTLLECGGHRIPAFWAYELGRNFPSARSTVQEEIYFRQWGTDARRKLENGTMQELSASLLYSLIATREVGDKDGH